MNLFAYLSLKDISNFMQGKYAEMGGFVSEDINRVFSQKCKHARYLELVEKFEDVVVLQQANAGKPGFEEGGVVVKLRIPTGVVEPRKGVAVHRFFENAQEYFVGVETYLINSKDLRKENFRDFAWDTRCESRIEEIKNQFENKDFEVGKSSQTETAERKQEG